MYFVLTHNRGRELQVVWLLLEHYIVCRNLYEKQFKKTTSHHLCNFTPVWNHTSNKQIPTLFFIGVAVSYVVLTWERRVFPELIFWRFVFVLFSHLHHLSMCLIRLDYKQSRLFPLQNILWTLVTWNWHWSRDKEIAVKSSTEKRRCCIFSLTQLSWSMRHRNVKSSATTY